MSPHTHLLKFTNKADVPPDKVINAIVWCRNKYGNNWSHYDNPSGIWATAMIQEEWRRFYFINERDLLLFSLTCL